MIINLIINYLLIYQKFNLFFLLLILFKSMVIRCINNFIVWVLMLYGPNPSVNDKFKLIGKKFLMYYFIIIKMRLNNINNILFVKFLNVWYLYKKIKTIKLILLFFVYFNNYIIKQCLIIKTIIDKI